MVQSSHNYLPSDSRVCLGSENWLQVSETQSSLPEEKRGNEMQTSAVTHCIVSSNSFSLKLSVLRQNFFNRFKLNVQSAG